MREITKALRKNYQSNLTECEKAVMQGEASPLEAAFTLLVAGMAYQIALLEEIVKQGDSDGAH